MIRPVMAARYSANGSYQEAETVATRRSPSTWC